MLLLLHAACAPEHIRHRAHGPSGGWGRRTGWEGDSGAEPAFAIRIQRHRRVLGIRNNGAERSQQASQLLLDLGCECTGAELEHLAGQGPDVLVGRPVMHARPSAASADHMVT